MQAMHHRYQDSWDAIWRGLLDRGVLVRQTGPAGWLRVTVGTPEENGMFRAALREVRGLGDEDGQA